MNLTARAAALAVGLLSLAAPAPAKAAELVSHTADYDVEVVGMEGLTVDGSLEIAALKACGGWRVVAVTDFHFTGEIQGQPVDFRVQSQELTEETHNHTLAGYRTVTVGPQGRQEAEGRLERQPGGDVSLDLTRNGQKLRLPVEPDVLFPVEASRRMLDLLQSGRRAFAIKLFSPTMHSAVQMEVWDIRPDPDADAAEDPAGLLDGAPAWRYSGAFTSSDGQRFEGSGGLADNGITTAIKVDLFAGITISASLTRVEPLDPQPCE